MCIAILNTKKTIDKATLKRCWKSNPDGAGMLFVGNGKLHVFKELKNFDVFYLYYQNKRRLFPDSNFVLHFRIATSGKVDVTNCHPFLISENLGFVHNGMINITPMHKKVSDTYTFNELILKKLPVDFRENKAIIELIENYIGSSKLVFLDSKNNASLINEKMGQWDGDNWYSNDSYKEAKKTCYSKYMQTVDSYKPDYCEYCNCYGRTYYVAKLHSYLCDSCKDFYSDSPIFERYESM